MKPNAEQRIVIEELEQNILLLASAGTGKTNTLARRIVNILASKRAKAEEILCLTFTNKGSREIKSAVQKELGAEANAMYMGTFHSFCLHILRTEGKKNSDFYQDLIVFDEEDAEILVLELRNDKWKGISTKDICNALAYVKEQRALRGNTSGEMLLDYQATVAAILKEEGSRKQLMRALRLKDLAADNYLMDVLTADIPRLATGYEQKLAENHAVDFTDLITKVYALFQDEDSVSFWRNAYRYICIDEAQDTSTLEYAVLRKICNGNKVLICGDFFQTIYTWRGSSPEELIENYINEFAPRIVTFVTNYRSSGLLFEAGFSTLEAMFPQIVKKTYAIRPQSIHAMDGDPIVIVESQSRERSAEAMYKKILSVHEQAKQREEEKPSVAILVRRNVDAQNFSEEFMHIRRKMGPEKRLDFYLVDDVKFFKRTEIKDVLAFLKVVINRHDSVSAKRIIEKFAPNIGKATIEKLESEDCRKTGIRLSDFLNIQNYTKDLFDDLVDSLNDENIIVFDVESTGVDTTTDEIIQIAAIRINAKGEELERFERFITPKGSVGESEAVHHFSDAFLAEHGEEAPVVLEAFRKFAENATIVGHNVQFDISILGSELKRHNLPEAKFKAVYDTLDLYRRYYPNEKNHKLEHLSQRFDTNHKPSHNALDDILATGELLVQIVRDQVIPTRDKRLAYMRMKSEFADFATVISTLWKKTYTERPTELLSYLMNHVNLKAYYEKIGMKNKVHPQDIKKQEDENRKRLENIRELYLIFKELEEEELYEKEDEFGYNRSEKKDISMRDILQRTIDNAVMTSSEMNPRRKDTMRIPIITVHQSKGAEFDYVFLGGLEENAFPTYGAIRSGDLEEEKRLFYVAITRPKKALFIMHSQINERGRYVEPSSLLKYLPMKYCKTVKY